jgi:hypothetical protein
VHARPASDMVVNCNGSNKQVTIPKTYVSLKSIYHILKSLLVFFQGDRERARRAFLWHGGQVQRVRRPGYDRQDLRGLQRWGEGGLHRARDLRGAPRVQGHQREHPRHQHHRTVPGAPQDLPLRERWVVAKPGLRNRVLNHVCLLSGRSGSSESLLCETEREVSCTVGCIEARVS